MTKALVETTGNFLLYEPFTGDVVYAERPGVVEVTNFFTARLALGQLRLLIADLPEGVSDKDFVEVLKASEGQIELAVAAFEAEFKPEAEVGVKDEVTSPVLKSDKAPKQPVAPKE